MFLFCVIVVAGVLVLGVMGVWSPQGAFFADYEWPLTVVLILFPPAAWYLALRTIHKSMAPSISEYGRLSGFILTLFGLICLQGLTGAVPGLSAGRNLLLTFVVIAWFAIPVSILARKIF